MSHSSYSYRTGRHYGQALLLAVLVMVFVAIIGVTFITVVAINIGQTGREEERDKARQAAEAGLAFANLQLTNSILATRWRPEKEVQSAVPTPVRLGPPPNNNPFYWTPFDQAQGWAGYNGTCDTAAGACEGNFIKFPDPRSTNPSFSAPNYMVKVEKIAPGDSDNLDNSQTGALRITTIGLSPDDPASFYKIVAYKAGPAQSPGLKAMRTVTNWDFENETVPVAQMPTTPTTGTTATLQDVQGKFPAENFYVLIGDPAGTLQPVFATAYNSATKSITFADSVTWTAGARVEIAAAFGAPTAVDYNRNSTADSGTEKVVFDVSQATNPGSIQVNGSTIIEGNLLSKNLRLPSSTTGLAGRLESSGLIQVTGTTAKVAGNVGTAIDGLLQSSTAANFPMSDDPTTTAVPAGTQAQQLQLVRDGADRITNNPAPSERKVQSFTPPSMMSGGEGFGRYRQLSKYSASLTSNPQGAAYGYGEGIYINNPQDREHINNGTGYREMTQKELTSLWFDMAGTTASYLRAGTPEDPDNATNVRSLEEQHLRGWIAPDEFLPRGALVEINDDATLTITLDPRDDGSTPLTTNLRNNDGPVPAKSWKKDDGTYEGASPEGGVYRRTNITWPVNGVIFAEGNIRIRGKSTTNPPRSLTVVSMNNIYIEDSLGAADKKVLLLARRNVVVNPTRVVGRPEAQTRLISASGTSVAVADGLLFSRGDRIQIGAGGGAQFATVTDVTGNTLILNATVTTPTDAVVMLQTDALNDDDATPATGDKPFFGDSTPYLKQTSSVMQRRFWNDTASAVRFAVRHGAEKRIAYSVGIDGTPPASADMTNGMESPPPTTSPRLVPSAEKKFIVTLDSGAPEDFPDDTVDATSPTLDDLIAELNSEHVRLPDPAATWWYDASRTPATTDYGSLKYWYLAGIGLRHEVDPMTAPPAFPFGQSILTDQEFPIATSVQVTIANPIDPPQTAVLRLENGGTYDSVNQLGFSPLHADAVDALTFDRSFYTDLTTGANAGFKYLTTDSRTIANNLQSKNFNTLIWSFHPDILGEFSDTAVGPALPKPLPRYGFKRIKLENVDQYNSGAFEHLDVGYTFDINAYVYAQEGSWLIMPGVPFDETIKTDAATGEGYVDLPGGTANVKDPGENLDFNRDGAITREEAIGVYRFSRYNYKIAFNGAIMENRTATVGTLADTDPLRRQVASWTDSWATVKTTTANFSGANFSNNLTFNDDPAISNFSTITYNYDPAAANGDLEADTGFYPPITPELMYQTG